MSIYLVSTVSFFFRFFENPKILFRLFGVSGDMRFCDFCMNNHLRILSNGEEGDSMGGGERGGWYLLHLILTTYDYMMYALEDTLVNSKLKESRSIFH